MYIKIDVIVIVGKINLINGIKIDGKYVVVIKKFFYILFLFLIFVFVKVNF